MKKYKNQFVIVIVLGLLLLGVSLTIIIKDTDLNLKTQQKIEGKVVDYGMTTYYSGKISKQAFYVELDNSNQKFAIVRGNRDYTKLENSISQLDSVKIYYRNSGETLNRNVFQIESSKGILYSYKEYNRNRSRAAFAALIIGLAITIIGYLKHKKINLHTALMKIVDSRYRN